MEVEECAPDEGSACRICRSKSDSLSPIYVGQGETGEHFAEKIHTYLPITSREGDLICRKCGDAILAWHRLYETCVRANSLLDSIASKSAVADKEKKADRSDENGVHPSAVSYKDIFITHNTLGSIKVNIDDKYIPSNVERCSFCSYTNGNVNVRISHMLDTHPDYFFNCDVCDSYIDRSQLIPHMSQHAGQSDDEDENGNASDGEIPEEKESGKRDKKTKEREADAFSSSSHSNDRFGPLPDSVFEAIKDNDEPQPKTLDDAKKSSRSTAGPRVCPICSKAFRVPSSYFYHMKNFHGGVKQHECSVCGRSFSTKSALTDHMTLHSGEKPYSCPACSKQFRSKASIYIHYNNVHCETKRFPCTMCNRSFKWKQKLLRHITSHTKEKKHFCPKCNLGFGVKGDLTRHMKKHETGDVWFCDQCKVSFRQKRYWKAHCEKKHPKT